MSLRGEDEDFTTKFTKGTKKEKKTFFGGCAVGRVVGDNCE